jgi:hypothetical protein
MKPCPVLFLTDQGPQIWQTHLQRIEHAHASHALRWIAVHIRMYIRGLPLSELRVKPGTNL